MTTLMQASNEWARRPADQRFLSLPDMLEYARNVRRNSVAKVLPNRVLSVAPVGDDDENGLAVIGPNGVPVLPTNWSFGQLSQRAKAPAGYMRELPAPLAADCINYGLKRRDVEELGILLTRGADGSEARLGAVTGPNYGRIWNETILAALVNRFGDGVTGHFRVPGEFGHAVTVNKENTTLYASDRDMFVFLADEERRIDMPNRRNGEPGSLARGFFVWNSEVGAQTFGVATFLFDFVCQNRIVWGADQYREIKIRHTSGAPHRWVEEVAPALETYARSETHSITHAVTSAQQARVEDVDKLLTRRFTKNQATAIKAAHLADEGRPIETLWDAVTGVTAYARGINYQNERVKLEREAGAILDMAA